jgi:hypothetical protein
VSVTFTILFFQKIKYCALVLILIFLFFTFSPVSMTDQPNVNGPEIINRKRTLEDTPLNTLEEEDDEHVTCLICSEVWTSGGQHCLVSLKCGHLFGKR